MKKNVRIDATIGVPTFVYDLLKKNHYKDLELGLSHPEKYNNAETHPALKKAILNAHLHANHFDENQSKKMEIVVTNGATGAIDLLISTAKSKVIVMSKYPYWFRVPVIVENNGKSLVRVKDPRTVVGGFKIATIPSNPLGLYEAFVDEGLNDMTYAWPSFCDGVKNIEVKNRTFVFSVAKLTGLCGLRIGWILTPDKEFAKYLKKQIEIRQSGVSSLAQEYAAKAISIVSNPDVQMMISKKLKNRRKRFKRAILKLGLRDISHSGMFAFVINKNPLEVFSKIGIDTLDGAVCGETRFPSARVSLGMPDKIFDEMISRIESA
jgi:aspartate/methionine/tyrosine aminotransferase